MNTYIAVFYDIDGEKLERKTEITGIETWDFNLGDTSILISTKEGGIEIPKRTFFSVETAGLEQTLVKLRNGDRLQIENKKHPKFIKWGRQHISGVAR